MDNNYHIFVVEDDNTARLPLKAMLDIAGEAQEMLNQLGTRFGKMLVVTRR